MGKAYIEVTEKSFEQDVLNSDVPVLVDFWAPWCGPCRQIAPHVEKLGEEYAGKVKVAKINVDHNQRIAARLGIRGIPAIKVFKGGKVVQQMTGMPANTYNRLKALVDATL